MKINLCLIVVFLSVFVVTAHVEIKPPDPQRYCGSQVADVLKALCHGRYYGFDSPRQTPKKRSLTGEFDTYMWDYGDLTDQYGEAKPSLQDPYYAPSSSLMQIPSKRQRILITDECCYKKPCYQSELLSYCHLVPKARDQRTISAEVLN